MFAAVDPKQQNAHSVMPRLAAKFKVRDANNILITGIPPGLA